MARAPWPADVQDRVRRLYEDTDTPLCEIAIRSKVPERTISRWRKRYGWTRPGGPAMRVDVPDGKWEAARAIHEGRNTIEDTIVLLGCPRRRYLEQARRRRWRDPPEPRLEAAVAEMPPRLAGLCAELADETLDRDALADAAARAFAYAGAIALAGQLPQAERTLKILAQIAPAIGRLPPPSGAERPHEPVDLAPATFDDVNRIIAEITERFYAFGEEGGAAGRPCDDDAGAAGVPS